MKKGMIIEFEGLDYSFKETNSKRLYNNIKENITDKTILVSFPNYESKSAMFVKKYLNGSYGNISEVNAYQASLLYAMDRYDTIKELDFDRLLEEGYIIILDRYTGSNMMFQSSKIEDIEEKIKFIEWTEDYEYNKLKLPKADLVIYMNMPVEVSHKLIFERENKTGDSIDLHESNYIFKKNVEDNAKIIIDKCGWKVVDVLDSDNNIKSEEEVFDLVWSNFINILKK